MTALSLCVTAAEVAGSVSFVIGDASMIGADGKSSPVARGDAVVPGLTLATGATGHIHVRMIDGAFLSVRPQSRLRIEDYRYDAATPANNRIKLVLEQGVARSITGRAGEAARENYRLNTPLAAIGIRGTDFVVQAGADVTRVTVQSGAVVMSPLASDCLASSIGPCKSAASRVLTAAMTNSYLELRSRNDVPLLVPAEKSLESPNFLAPPRPEEPRGATDKQAKPPVSSDNREAAREVAADLVKNRVDASQAPPPAPSTTAPTPLPPLVVVETAPVVPPVVITPVISPKFWWGRWGSVATAALATQARDVKDIEGLPSNEIFGLWGTAAAPGQSFVVPATGVAKFQLADSEAVFVSASRSLSAAKVTDPSLTVDFGKRRFETALTVTGTGVTPVSIQASGSVTHQGYLYSDNIDLALGATVFGGVSNITADQAGYVFQKRLPDNSSVQGVTRWTR